MIIFNKISAFFTTLICILTLGVFTAGCSSDKKYAEAVTQLEDVAANVKYKDFFNKTTDDTNSVLNYNINLSQNLNVATKIGESNYKNTYNNLFEIANATAISINILYKKVNNEKTLKTAESKDITAISKGIKNLSGLFDKLIDQNIFIKNRTELFPSNNITDLDAFNNLILAVDGIIDNNIKISQSLINIFNKSLSKENLTISKNTVSFVPGQYEAFVLENYIKMVSIVKDNLIKNTQTEIYYYFDNFDTNTLASYSYMTKDVALSLDNITDYINTNYFSGATITSVETSKNKYLTKKAYLDTIYLKDGLVAEANKKIDFINFSKTVKQSESGYNAAKAYEYLQTKYTKEQREAYNNLAKYFYTDILNSGLTMLLNIATI